MALLQVVLLAVVCQDFRGLKAMRSKKLARSFWILLQEVQLQVESIRSSDGQSMGLKARMIIFCEAFCAALSAVRLVRG